MDLNTRLWAIVTPLTMNRSHGLLKPILVETGATYLFFNLFPCLIYTIYFSHFISQLSASRPTLDTPSHPTHTEDIKWEQDLRKLDTDPTNIAAAKFWLAQARSTFEAVITDRLLKSHKRRQMLEEAIRQWAKSPTEELSPAVVEDRAPWEAARSGRNSKEEALASMKKNC